MNLLTTCKKCFFLASSKSRFSGTIIRAKVSGFVIEFMNKRGDKDSGIIKLLAAASTIIYGFDSEPLYSILTISDTFSIMHH